MKCALEDSASGIALHIVQFEAILNAPEQEIRAICNFAELDFSNDMLPQQSHKIPFGSMYRDRWYPIRKEVNDQYLDTIDEQSIQSIDKICGETARVLGYQKPTSKV